MSGVARYVLIALTIVLLDSPAWFTASANERAPFLIATVLLLATNIALVVSWDRGAPTRDRESPAKDAVSLIVVAGAVLLLSIAARDWLHQILTIPLDPQRADMLVVVQAGIRRLLQGHDPYAMYNVPWPATLPYGPVMWGPLILPALAHADIRIATLIGVLFAPCLCALAAAHEWAAGRRIVSAAWLGLLAALAFSPAVRQFIPIGHTPGYWPLLALIAWFVARERWEPAAIVSGLLIVARTTMIAIAPVILIAVWYRDRPRLPRAAALLFASFALPFLPFAIWDWPALRYALYGSYQVVIKGYVWASTDWAQHTIGTTGTLLAHGWGRAVETLQATVMLGVYAGAAFAIRAGRRPLPWLAFALLAFSMTTLWPVTYIYLDVALLWLGAAAAEIAWATHARQRLNPWTTALLASMAVAGIAIWYDVSADVSLDIGRPPARDYLYAGFSGDEAQGDLTYSWIDGTRAEILIPRRSRRDATIDIACLPHLPTPGAVQQLSASLNGTLIGTVTLPDGWQHVELRAPGRAWQIGVNELTLFLSSAVSPKELGLSDDARRLSIAVDRLTVRTP